MENRIVEDYEIEKTPSYMLLPSIKFRLSLPEFREDSSLKKTFLEIIKSNNMSKYYKQSCKHLHWKLDYNIYTPMKNINLQEWSHLEILPGDLSPEMSDTIENLEKKLDLSSRTGDTKKGIKVAFSIIENLSFSNTSRTEGAFALFRLAFFDMNFSLMDTAIKKLENIMESNTTANWYYKNKCKAYKAISRMSRGDFKGSTDLLSECFTTFESYELIPFKKILEYMTIAGTLSWSRSEIKKNMINNGSFIQSLTLEDPELLNYFNALYDCQYSKFLKNLNLIVQRMRRDPLIYSRRRFYMREMKIRAYSQILQAYKSLSLKGISEEFEIDVSEIEKDLTKYIQSKRLLYKIDSISQQVCSVCSGLSSSSSDRQPSETSCQRETIYKNVVKSGDIHLNRIKMLLTALDT